MPIRRSRDAPEDIASVLEQHIDGEIAVLGSTESGALRCLCARQTHATPSWEVSENLVLPFEAGNPGYSRPGAG